jgi:hypothetical protein
LLFLVVLLVFVIIFLVFLIAAVERQGSIGTDRLSFKAAAAAICAIGEEKEPKKSCKLMGLGHAHEAAVARELIELGHVREAAMSWESIREGSSAGQL